MFGHAMRISVGAIGAASIECRRGLSARTAPGEVEWLLKDDNSRRSIGICKQIDHRNLLAYADIGQAAVHLP
jgi:hypothetical protein